MKNAHLLLASFLILTTLLGCEKNEILDSNLENIEADYTTKQADLVKLPIKVSEDFIWGICGHPLGFSTDIYNIVDIDYQLELLNEHQIDTYRFGVRIAASSGLPTEDDRLIQMLTMIDQNNGKFLPVLRIDTEINILSSLDNHYQRGMDFAREFFIKYGAYFDVITLGNELDLDYIIRGADGLPIHNGSLPEHYDLDMLDRVAKFKLGLIAQLELLNIDAKLMISTTGRSRVGYLDYILNHWEVPFDIIGLHHYTRFDANYKPLMNPLNVLNGRTFVKYCNDTYNNMDIWITEINRRSGSYQETEGDTQKEVVNSFIDEIDLNNCIDCHSIKAFFVYELLDSSHHDEEHKAHHGIMDHISGTDFESKPVANLLKFRIEETKHGYKDYVYNLFEWGLGFINLEEIENLAAEFKTLKEEGQVQNPHTEFLEGIIPRTYSKFISEFYFQIFETAIPRSELSYWLNEMENGATRENVMTSFIASDEFLLAAGGDIPGLVDLIFERVFYGEDETTVGIFKVNLIYAFDDIGIDDRQYVIQNEVLNSEFLRREFVIKQFIEILDRSEDSLDTPANLASIDYWSDQMHFGLGRQALINRFLLSNEFWKRSVRKGYERKNPDYIGTMTIFPHY